jgi:predicted XRE-type DNA-binding protein
MNQSLKEEIGYRVGSGNVFADLDLPDADELQEKAEIVASILKAMRERSLTQMEAGRIMGLPQSKVSDLCRGKWDHFSLSRLIRLSRLIGNDVRIVINPSPNAPPPSLQEAAK